MHREGREEVREEEAQDLQKELEKREEEGRREVQEEEKDVEAVLDGQAAPQQIVPKERVQENISKWMTR